MIGRYTLPEMGAIWTEENKYRQWLEVEIAACSPVAIVVISFTWGHSSFAQGATRQRLHSVPPAYPSVTMRWRR